MELNSIVLNKNSSIRDAMIKMSNECIDTLMVIDDHFKLLAVVTNGDIRRRLLDNGKIDESIQNAMNSNYISASVSDRHEDLLSLIKNGVTSIPIINENGKLIGCVGQELEDYIPIYKPELEGMELSYVSNCIQNSWISSSGSFVKRFEDEFSKFTGLDECITTSSGSTALELAFSLCDLNPSDEIIAPALTFASPINSAIRTGAKIKLIDVDISNFCIDEKLILSNLSKNTKVIVVVNLYGYPYDVKSLREKIPSNILIIEDCAESFGSRRNDIHSGFYSDFATFSFFGNKTITTGEGGMLFCKNAKDRKRAKVLRDHGMNKEKKYWHDEVGFNFRMTNLQAAVGVAQLEKAPSILSNKQRIFDNYHKLLSKHGFVFISSSDSSIFNSRWLVLVSHPLIFKKGVDELERQMKLIGIDVRKVFYPLSSMPTYKIYCDGNFDSAHKLFNSYICLPSSPSLTENQIKRISSKISMILGSNI